MKPFISICIPTYNRAPYLRRCLRSVIAYDKPDIEIIISDNASTDKTKEVVEEFRDERIVYIRNEINVGPIGNFYKLLSSAKGEYIFLLTDDDFLIPDCLDTVVAFLKSNEVDSFKSDIIVYNEKSKSAYNYSHLKETCTVAPTDFEKQAKIWRSTHVFTTCGFRRKMIPPKFISDEKFLWYPSMLLAGLLSERMGYIAQPLAVHTWENELFWEIDEANKENILRDSIVDSLFALLEYGQNREKVRTFAANLASAILSNSNHEFNKLPGRLVELLSETDIADFKRRKKERNSIVSRFIIWIKKKI